MKKTFFKSILCASLFVGALTSCNEVEDLYNPALVREQAKKALGLDIAPDQDWNMTSVVTANITLNEDALSDYSFRIYSGNPLDKNSGAAILADYPVKTDAQGKASASFKFEMPSYLEYVYVARIDNHGRRLIGISGIKDGVINETFGERSSVTTKAIDEYALPVINNEYTKAGIYNILDDAHDITNGLGGNGLVSLCRFSGGKTIAKLENSTYTDHINMNVQYYYETPNNGQASNPDMGTFKLIIGEKGILKINNNTSASGVDIIVAEGGKLIINKTIEMSTNARIFIMPGGIIETENTEEAYIYLVNPTNLIYNAGTINTNYIETRNGATIYNTTDAILKANTIKSAGGEGWENFINWGKIEATEITSNGNQGTIYNGCLIRATSLKVDKISLNSNSTIEIPNIECNAFYLRENSIVRATSSIKANQAILIKYIPEPESQQTDGNALISTESIYLGNGINSIDNRVFFEVNPIKIYHTDYTNENNNNDVRLAFKDKKIKVYPIGNANLPIDPAKCTGNGNNPTPNVPEENELAIYTYAFEDLDQTVGDYDMNDVVLKCTGPIDGNITIRLVAVGAEKNLYVYFKNRQNNKLVALYKGKEVHTALGVEAGTITNTSTDFTIVDKVVEEAIDVDEGFLFTQHGDIYIIDEQGRESHIPNFDSTFSKGGAPYGICVPYDWKYPKEYNSIITAYPTFVYWAGDVNVQNWYTIDKAIANNVY